MKRHVSWMSAILLPTQCFLFIFLSSPALQAKETQEFDFARDIKPILSDHCFACHGPDEHQRQADVRLDTAEGIADVVDTKDWQASLLYERIHTDDADLLMPPPEYHKPISTQQRKLISAWLQSGAEFQQHWAFAAPKSAELTPAAGTDVIDTLIEQRMDAVGLEPNGDAARRTLLRRVTLDLTGLPPTLKQISTALQDASPDAYEHYVERLLATPAYGEHMARYWLDVVRYGDTHGLHLDNYREMWPYRDWVIDSFNQNKPFDVFITEQLAGDLLPDATLEQQIASGFNRLNVTTNEGGSIYDEVFARNVIDRTDAFGTIFLGLTTGCAVCHDHKFDPISQQDYYSLSAYFNSLDGRAMDGNSKDHPPTVRVPSPEQQAQLQEVQTELQLLEEQLKGPLPNVDAAQQRWEAELIARSENIELPTQSRQQKLTPRQVNTTNGSEVRVTKAQTVELVGQPQAKDDVIVTTDLPSGTWRVLRINALTDKKNPRVGLGSNKNAVLSELVVETRSDESATWQPLKIDRAAADIEQAGEQFAIGNAIDGKVDGNRGWAVAGHEQTGPRTAWFVFAPLEVDASATGSPSQMRVTMKYQSVYAQHMLRNVELTLQESSEDVGGLEPIVYQDVHIAGPFPIENPNPGYNREFAGEKAKGFDPEQIHKSGELEFRWQHRGDILPGGVNQLPYIADRNSATVLHQTIVSPKKQKADLLLGTSDGHVVFLNGKQVTVERGDRALDPLKRVIPLELNQGDNHLFIKVVRHSGDGKITYALSGAKTQPPELLITRLKTTQTNRSEQEAKSIQKLYRAAFCDDPSWLALQDMRRGLIATRDKINNEIATTLVWKETKTPRDAFILKRGQYDDPGEKVLRATPAFLPPLPEDAPNDRLGLARWLTDASHPLTSRVIVNRFWQQLFGVGLVKSSEDFGSQGTPPTHPRLLDQLALDFQSSGWDVKAMMKRLVMTRAYRRDATASDEMIALDPSNRFLARGPRFRLDAEMLRDQLLAVSGLLVDQRGGPSVKPPQPDGLWKAVGYSGSNTVRFVADQGDKAYRRSVYTFWKRTSAPAVMATFDAPSRESCTARRERTNTPMQALLLMNEQQALEAAQRLGEEAASWPDTESVDQRMAKLFERVVLRPPSSTELAQLSSLLTDLTNYYSSDIDQAHALVGRSEPNVAAWTVVASTLINLDEVVCK